MSHPRIDANASVDEPAGIADKAAVFREIRFSALDSADRHRWEHSTCSSLASLVVPCCGVYVEAEQHRCGRRTGELDEGVLIYCLDGHGYAKVTGIELEVEAGDLLYCPPGLSHAYGAEDKDPWTICWMHLSGRHLDHYERLLGLNQYGPVQRLGILDDVKAAFEQLIRLYPPQDDRRLFAIQAQAIHILGLFASIPATSASKPVQTRMVQAAIADMETWLDSPFDLQRLALHSGCTPAYFSRTFKQVTGVPPVIYFTRRKMDRAAALLNKSRLRVGDIATRVGFQDPFYFSKCFKKHMGLAPEAYRRLFGEGNGALRRLTP